jgi:hypothetical protein
MTSHELAHLLLEEPDAPVVGLDDAYGYFDLAAVFPVRLYKDKNEKKWMSQLHAPTTRTQKDQSFTAIVIS